MVTEIDIKGIGYHSGEIRDAYLFVAIRGYITDGHKYIEKAMDKTKRIMQILDEK